MKVVAIVQARLGSTRLPAKVLLDLQGKTALERCLSRVARVQGVDEVVVATTDTPVDDVLVRVCERLGFRVTRGSQDDVLSRYQVAAQASGADVIMRCTSDCPLLDPGESGAVLAQFLARFSQGSVDYASNVLERRVPRGLDTEVVSRDALERAHREATDPALREHVTLPIVRRPDVFRCLSTEPRHPTLRGADQSHQRWTLDTLEDYHFLASVYDLLGDRAADADVRDVLDILEAHPTLTQINAGIAQKVV
ncbi:MAG: glycosyltransferase family protein [Myxococcales bacterium]